MSYKPNEKKEVLTQDLSETQKEDIKKSQDEIYDEETEKQFFQDDSDVWEIEF